MLLVCVWWILSILRTVILHTVYVMNFLLNDTAASYVFLLCFFFCFCVNIETQDFQFTKFIDGFHGTWILMGHGFTSRGQESRSVFGAAVCKIQTSKWYIESLPLVLKNKVASLVKVKGSLYSCLLIAHLPSRSRTFNWHLETIYTNISPAGYEAREDLGSADLERSK